MRVGLVGNQGTISELFYYPSQPVFTTFVLITFLKISTPNYRPPVVPHATHQIIKPVIKKTKPKVITWHDNPYHCTDSQYISAEKPFKCIDKETPAPPPEPAQQPVYSPPISSSVAGCGDNFYANYIYEHESGCSLWDANPSSGACGIGQAWPCSKLTNVCPNLDYACENSFFTSYAISTYGSWANAYNFWLGNSWW